MTSSVRLSTLLLLSTLAVPNAQAAPVATAVDLVRSADIDPLPLPWTGTLATAKAAVAARPESTQAWLLKARAEKRLGQDQAAEASLNRARALPEWSKVKHLTESKTLSEISAQVLRAPQAGLGSVADALLETPSDPKLLYLRALALGKLGQLAAARAALAQARLAAPGLSFADPQPLAALEEALSSEQASSARAATPDEVLAMLSTGQWQEALMAATAATAARPDSAKAWLLKARAEMRLDQSAAALSSLKRAQALPQWRGLKLSIPVKARDEIDAQVSRDPQEALGSVADALLVNPGNAELLYLQALAHARLGQLAEGRAALARARIDNPGLSFAEPQRLNALERTLAGTAVPAAVPARPADDDLRAVMETATPEGRNPIDVLIVIFLALAAGIAGVWAAVEHWLNRKRIKVQVHLYNAWATAQQRKLDEQERELDLLNVDVNPQERLRGLREREGLHELGRKLWEAKTLVLNGTWTADEAISSYTRNMLMAAARPPKPAGAARSPAAPRETAPTAQAGDALIQHPASVVILTSDSVPSATPESSDPPRSSFSSSTPSYSPSTQGSDTSGGSDW